MASISKIMAQISADFRDTGWILKRGHSGTKFATGTLLGLGGLLFTGYMGDPVLAQIPFVAASAARKIGDVFIWTGIELGMLHLIANRTRKIKSNPSDNCLQGYLKPEHRSQSRLQPS